MSASATNETYTEALTQNTLDGPQLTQFYIGLGLAVSSSLFIGSSFIIKKKALIKVRYLKKIFINFFSWQMVMYPNELAKVGMDICGNGCGGWELLPVSHYENT